MALILADLNTVYTETFDARTKWKNIVLALGISKATIESTEVRCNHNPDDCYREGLTTWLRSGEGSWRDLVKALSSHTVGHNDLARKMERKYLQPLTAGNNASNKAQNSPFNIGSCLQKITKELTMFANQKLGTGAFGQVFKGSFNDVPCAVKLLHHTVMQIQMNLPTSQAAEGAVKTFDRECEFLKSFQHPNIVQHLSTEKHPTTGNAILVIELMDCTLRVYFSSYGHNMQPQEHQLSLSKDVSSGLAYIHGKHIIHRDLCGDNILLKLVQPVPVAKISDFGMSRLLDPSQLSSTLTTMGHRMGYLPPEASRLDEEQYDYSLDVFSLGVIMVQIVHKLETVKSPRDRSTYVAMIPRNHMLRHFIDECLKEDMTRRPVAKDVYVKLERRLEVIRSAGLKAFSVVSSDLDDGHRSQSCELLNTGTDTLQRLTVFDSRENWSQDDLTHRTKATHHTAAETTPQLWTPVANTGNTGTGTSDTTTRVLSNQSLNQFEDYFVTSAEQPAPYAILEPENANILPEAWNETNDSPQAPAESSSSTHHHHSEHESSFISADFFPPSQFEESCTPSAPPQEDINIDIPEGIFERSAMPSSYLPLPQDDEPPSPTFTHSPSPSRETSRESPVTAPVITFRDYDMDESCCERCYDSCCERCNDCCPGPDDCFEKFACWCCAICIVTAVTLFVVTLLLGVLGAIFYPGNDFAGNQTFVQINEASIPLLFSFNPTGHNTLTLIAEVSENSVDIFHIDYYSRDCALVGTEVREVNQTGDFSPVLSNTIDERYVAFRATLTYTIEIPDSSKNLMDGQIRFVVFNNLEDYQTFLTSGSWSTPYTQHSIQNSISAFNVTFNEASYYYTGLRIESSDNIQSQISYHISGNLRQYNRTSLVLGCSVIVGPSANNTCTINLSIFSIERTSEVCIVAQIPPRSDRNTIPNQLLINYNTDSLSRGTIQFYFFLPFIIVLIIVICFCCICCVFICWATKD